MDLLNYFWILAIYLATCLHIRFQMEYRRMIANRKARENANINKAFKQVCQHNDLPKV